MVICAYFISAHSVLLWSVTPRSLGLIISSVAQTHTIMSWGRMKGWWECRSQSDRHVQSRKQRPKDSVCSDTHSSLCNSSAIEQESVRLRTVLLLSSLKAFVFSVLNFPVLCVMLYLYPSSFLLIVLFRANVVLFLCLQCLNHFNSVPCLSGALCDIYLVMSSLSFLIVAELLAPVLKAGGWTVSLHWIPFIFYFTPKGACASTKAVTEN